MGKMVDVHMEVDTITEVIGIGEGSEAARERIDAVVGKNFDDESKAGDTGISILRVDRVSERESRVKFRG